MAMHVHVAYMAIGGGGAGVEVEINTANYGRYQVPEGQGQYLLGWLPLTLTPALTAYERLVSREWDGEDIYGLCKPTGTLDPYDYEWLTKPRFCPGGSLIYIYGANAVNEVMTAVLIFNSVGDPAPDPNSFKGESVRVATTQVANSGAAAWTVTRSWQAPKTRDPFLITGVHQASASGIIARLVIPNMKNSTRPPVFMTPVPVAGVEGPYFGKLMEPVEVKGGELITIESFCTAGAVAPAWIEYCAKMARTLSSSGKSVTGSSMSVYGGQPFLTKKNIVGMSFIGALGK